MYTYVCMPGTLLTGDKKIRDTMVSLLLSERALPGWGLYPQLATMVDRRGISAENAQKRGQLRRQPHLQPGPCPLCKGNHWRSKCPCLQMEGEVPPLMD
jgi:hypothetical protein